MFVEAQQIVFILGGLFFCALMLMSLLWLEFKSIPRRIQTLQMLMNIQRTVDEQTYSGDRLRQAHTEAIVKASLWGKDRRRIFLS